MSTSREVRTSITRPAGSHQQRVQRRRFQPDEIARSRARAEGIEFDLAFIDGNHRFEGVFLDLVYSGRLLKQGAIVFVDDTQLPGVRRAVEFCLANLQWAVENGGNEGVHEWLVLRTGSHDLFQRPYTEFADF